jgi:hypothetical protein
MGFFFTLLLYVGFTLLGALLRPHAPRPGRPDHPEFKLPTIDPSRPIPIVWGDVYLKDPAVLWWGNFKGIQFQGTQLFGGADLDYDVYYVAVHVGLCHGPVDSAVDISWDDKPVTARTTQDNGSWSNIQTNRLAQTPLSYTGFGVPIFDPRTPKLIPRDYLITNGLNNPPKGTEQEWNDVYYFYRGTLDQPSDPVLPQAAYANAPVPNYFGLCHMVLWNVALGMSGTGTPFMQGLSVGVTRRPNQLGVTATHEQIGNDANPACMLYELLTDTRWGLGIPSASIDVTTFRAVGETLYTEGFGMSLVVSDQQAGRDIAAEILRHIDGVMFTDPATALLTLKLVRSDYVFADLPVYDDTVFHNLEISRPATSETRNHVRLRYQTPKGVEKIATETNLANVQKRGGLVVQDVSYPGITDPALAQRVAARDLKTFSYEFARISGDVDRRAWAIRPASVFRLTSAKYGITDMVCRVVRPSLGTLTDGQIHIEAVEDAFNVNWTGMPPPTNVGLFPVAFTKKATGTNAQLYVHKVGVAGIDAWAAGGTLSSVNGGTVATNQTMVDDGAGGFILVWQDLRAGGSNYDIYAQRYNAAGVPLWPSGGVVVCNQANSQSAPRACSDGAGGVIVAWRDTRGLVRPFVQRISASGAAQWTANGVLAGGTSGTSEGIDIIPDGFGGALVSWTNSTKAFAQRINAAGALLWAANGVQLITGGGDTTEGPAIISDGSGGLFAACHDTRADSGNIYAQHLNASGVPQWTAAGIAVCTAAFDQHLFGRKLIISDGAGGFIAGWEDGRNGGVHELFVQRMNASGVAQWASNGISLGSLATAIGNANLVSDGAGGAIATWVYSTGLYAQRVNAAGTKLWGGSPKLILGGATVVASPDSAPDGSGGVIVFWYAGLGTTDYTLYGQQISAAGVDLWAAGGKAIVATVQNHSTKDGSLSALVAATVAAAGTTTQASTSALQPFAGSSSAEAATIAVAGRDAAMVAAQAMVGSSPAMSAPVTFT